MTSVNIQFIIHYVIITIWIEKSCGTRTEFDFPSYANEYIGIKGDRNYGNKIYHSRQSSSDLPITLQAAVERTQNFWNYNPRINSFRRTFLDDSGYFNYNKSKIFPIFSGLINFIRPLYDNISNQKSTKSRNSSYQTISEPYKYEHPFELHITTEKNYLPPPKPIRASIIKLETVTRSPHFYEPLDYNSTPKYYQGFLNFQKNETEKLNTLHIDEIGFHLTPEMNFRTGQSSSFKHVSNQKKFIEPKWSYSYNFNRPDLNDVVTNKMITAIIETHNTSEENNIEKNIPNVSTFTEIVSNIENKEFSKIHDMDSEDNISFLENKSINMNNKYNAGLRSPTDNRKIKCISTKTLEVTSEIISENCTNNSNRIINVERIRDNNTLLKIFEKHRPFINDSNSIKTVTDLTIAGLSKSKEQSANIPIYTKYFNMSNLIEYELNKLKERNFTRPRMDKFTEKAKNSFFTNANKISKIIGNDDFSLDLKILRDTNWDGFTTQIPETFTTVLNAPTVIMNLKESETDRKNYAIKQRKVSNDKASLENVKPLTDLIRNNSLENGENSGNKSVIIETRVSKSVSKAMQFLHNVKSKKLLLHNNERNKSLSQMKSEKEHKPNFMKNESLKPMEDFNKNNIVIQVNNKNETMKRNNSFYINNNAKLFSNVKRNKLLNSTLTLTKNFNISKESSQNDSEKLNTSYIKNRSRRGRKYRQRIKIKTQRNHEKTFHNSSSPNNASTNRKISQKNVKTLPIILDSAKNYSQKNRNYNIISQNKSSEIMTQYDGNEYSENGKSKKKLKRKRPARAE